MKCQKVNTFSKLFNPAKRHARLVDEKSGGFSRPNWKLSRFFYCLYHRQKCGSRLAEQNFRVFAFGKFYHRCKERYHEHLVHHLVHSILPGLVQKMTVCIRIILKRSLLPAEIRIFKSRHLYATKLTTSNKTEKNSARKMKCLVTKFIYNLDIFQHQGYLFS